MVVLFLLLNGTQYARPKIAVRSLQSQNRAARSTQGGGGGGVTLKMNQYCEVLMGEHLPVI